MHAAAGAVSSVADRRQVDWCYLRGWAAAARSSRPIIIVGITGTEEAAASSRDPRNSCRRVPLPGRFVLVSRPLGLRRFVVPRAEGCGVQLMHVATTGAVPAMKPEATATGRSGRWPLENNLNVWWAQVLRTLQQMTRRWRHWWFPTTSCFGVTNHSEAASLWLVRQDRTTINSGSPPSCGATFWQRSVASPSEMGWLASKVSRYLSILCLW